MAETESAALVAASSASPLTRGAETWAADERRWLLLAVALAAGVGCKPAWPRYTAPDGTFTAEMPAPLRTDAERTEGNQRLVSVESRGEAEQGFLVQRRRPISGLRLQSDAVLDNFCTEFARARSYAITTDARGTRRDGRQAQLCAFQNPGLEIRMQVIAAGQCIYTLMAMWRGPAPDVDRFFDGFAVLRDCPVEQP